MRRVSRWIYYLAAVVSAPLFVGVCALWAKSYAEAPLDYYVVRPGRSYGIGTERGAAIAFLQEEWPAYREGDPRDAQVRAVGFRYLRITSGGMCRWNLVLPFWALACAVPAPLACWLAWQALRGGFKWRQLWRGHCPACGYDLRATPQRCPECGAVPRAARKATSGPGIHERTYCRKIKSLAAS